MINCRLTLSKLLRPVNLILSITMLSGIGLSIRDSWDKYLHHLHEFYDVGNYTTIAEIGYNSVSISGFHPLWPLVIRSFSTILGLTGQADYALLAGILSSLIFITSIFILSPKFIEASDEFYGPVALSLFVLNPTSIFHVTGFSESLCTLLIAFLLRELMGSKRLLVLGSIAIFLSLARPVAYFLPLSAMIAWPLSNLLTRPLSKDWKIGASIAIGSIVGYLLLCSYLYSSLGDFFAQAKAHDMWGRKFGFYFQLIYAPASVGGSSQVLFWDLIAFYLPILLFSFSIYKKTFDRRLDSPYAMLFKDPIYWFFLLLTCAHSAAAFLSYPIFASTARHIFGIPCIFYCLARLFSVWKVGPKTILVMLLCSAIFYIRWWARFGKGSWIG